MCLTGWFCFSSQNSPITRTGDSACSSLSTSRAPSAASHNSVITSGFESASGLNGHVLPTDNRVRATVFNIK